MNNTLLICLTVLAVIFGALGLRDMRNPDNTPSFTERCAEAGGVHIKHGYHGWKDLCMNPEAIIELERTSDEAT